MSFSHEIQAVIDSLQSHMLIIFARYFVQRQIVNVIELIGEFTGKNTIHRVLADGKIETSNQGMGKILELDASKMSTAITTVSSGTFV